VKGEKPEQDAKPENPSDMIDIVMIFLFTLSI